MPKESCADPDDIVQLGRRRKGRCGTADPAQSNEVVDQLGDCAICIERGQAHRRAAAAWHAAAAISQGRGEPEDGKGLVRYTTVTPDEWRRAAPTLRAALGYHWAAKHHAAAGDHPEAAHLFRRAADAYKQHAVRVETDERNRYRRNAAAAYGLMLEHFAEANATIYETTYRGDETVHGIGREELAEVKSGMLSLYGVADGRPGSQATSRDLRLAAVALLRIAAILNLRGATDEAESLRRQSVKLRIWSLRRSERMRDHYRAWLLRARGPWFWGITSAILLLVIAGFPILYWATRALSGSQSLHSAFIFSIQTALLNTPAYIGANHGWPEFVAILEEVLTFVGLGLALSRLSAALVK